jgi:hypothetical protein
MTTFAAARPVHPWADLALRTWSALVAPRRAVPIAIVCVPMVVAQARFSTVPGAVFAGVAMCLGFVAVGPLAWRICVPTTGPWGRRLLGGLAYGAVGAMPALVALATIRPYLSETFLTSGINLLIVTVLFWVGGWGLARDVRMEEELRDAAQRTDALRREAEDARLLAMRAQLDPHFLFNTLNAIAEWCREDPAVAERAILELSGMLRTILAGVGPSRWPLAREIELVDSLFSLHRIRDPGVFSLRRDVPDDVGDVLVPPLLLLPLVENAMTHGPGRGHRGEVAFTVRLGQKLRIEVENPGPFAGARSGGTGLEMAHSRLQLAYGDAASLVMAQIRGRTRCTVEMPVERGGS